ncbi:hypothetical protein CEXT_609811 [Caerostris extrusa]|uniref:Uncharacterized protein n=1 Tax=Caerostris extrusa TaxID=172846 RepID=A0AAV4SNA0_CAEEX|nr:hypothetical protein CEXT_609811 [Caerostris extrusa]
MAQVNNGPFVSAKTKDKFKMAGYLLKISRKISPALTKVSGLGPTAGPGTTEWVLTFSLPKSWRFYPPIPGPPLLTTLQPLQSTVE